MKIIKTLLSLLLTTALVLSLGSSFAFADSADADEAWNIVLVVDCSSSLSKDDQDGPGSKATDKSGLRFEAIESLLGSLNADYADVGAVVFTANELPNADPRTGTDTYPISSIKTEYERSMLMDYLEEAGEWNNTKILPRGTVQTDYYTALLVAQEMLHNTNNGRPGAIFLFTDGALSVLNVDKAKANLNRAIKGIQDDGTLLCGVYLNTSNIRNNTNSDSLSNIIKQANEGNGYNLSDLYVEIHDATDCYEPTDRFLLALGYDMIIEGGEVFRGTKELSFEMPGIGVDKLAIRLSTQERTQETQINNVVRSVTFTDPVGNTVNGGDVPGFRGIYRNVYELTRADIEGKGMQWGGEWKMKVTMNDTNAVAVIYDPVYTANVDAQLEPAVVSQRAKTDLTLTASLAQAAKADDYIGYSCVLRLSTPSGEREELLQYDAALNGFPYELKNLEYGSYSATAVFICSLLAETSNFVAWEIVNLPPEAKAISPVKFSLFAPGEWVQKVDLSQYITDEDPINQLSFSLPVGGSGVTLNGAEVAFSAFHFGSIQDLFGADEDGNVFINIADMQGATLNLPIKVEGGGNAIVVPAFIAAVILILVLLVAAVIIIRKIVGNIPSGHCTVEFEAPNRNDKTIDTVLSVPAPGTTSTVRRNTTLYKMISAELSKDVVDGVNPQDVESIKNFVEELAQPLSEINVKVGTAKDSARGRKGKKVSAPVPLVLYDGKKTLLFNKNIDLTIDGEYTFTLSYHLDGYDADDESSTDVGNDYGDDYGGEVEDDNSFYQGNDKEFEYPDDDEEDF